MKRSISLSTKKLFIPIVLSIIAITFFSIRTDTFSSAANYATILREMATPLLISCGMCFVMASGYIDLSVGAIAGFLCMLASRMIDWGLPIIIVLLLMVVVGTMCGLINSIVLHRFNLNPFVGTLAMQNVYRGLVWVISSRYANGSAYSVRITDPLIKELNGAVIIGGFKIYYSLIAAIICMLICQIIVSKTKFGMNVYAMGSNLRAAELTGINVVAVQRYSYMLCGAMTAICAIFLLARSQCATTTLGSGLEFDAISALVVGGASAMGASENAGKASPIGAALGAFFLYAVYNGIYKLGLPTAYQQIIQGAALIVMLAVDGILTIIRIHRKQMAFGSDQEQALREGS